MSLCETYGEQSNDAFSYVAWRPEPQIIGHLFQYCMGVGSSQLSNGKIEHSRI